MGDNDDNNKFNPNKAVATLNAALKFFSSFFFFPDYQLLRRLDQKGWVNYISFTYHGLNF